MREPRPVKQDFDKRSGEDAELVRRFPTAEKQDQARAAMDETRQRIREASQELTEKLRAIEKPAPVPTPFGIDLGKQHEERLQAVNAEHKAKVAEIIEAGEKKLEQIERDDPNRPSDINHDEPNARGGEGEKELDPIITDARADKQLEKPPAKIDDELAREQPAFDQASLEARGQTIADAAAETPTLTPEQERQARIDAIREAREARDQAEHDYSGPERGL